MTNKTLSDFPVLTNLDAASVAHVQKELVDYQVPLDTLTQYVTENAEYAALGDKIDGAEEKTTPADADMVGLMDSAASNILKKLSWANIKATLLAWLDTGASITPLTEKTTPVDADMTQITDSVTSNILKKLSWGNVKATLKTYFDTIYASQGTFGGIASITSAVAIANTETVVVSKTLPANTMRAGTTFRVSFSGVGTTGSTAGTSEFKIRIGSTTLAGNAPAYYDAANAASKTNYKFKGEALVTVRSAGASGTVIGTMILYAENNAQLFVNLVSIGTGSLVAVDTTAEKIIELTYKSGNAGTTLTFSTALIEIVKL